MLNRRRALMAMQGGSPTDTWTELTVLTWTVGKTITSTGSISTVTYGSYSAFVGVAGATVKYTGAVVDSNGKDIIVFLHEYAGSTWKRRTRMYTGDEVTVGSDCTRWRFNFAHSSSDGTAMTQAIIDDCFSAEYTADRTCQDYDDVKLSSIQGGSGISVSYSAENQSLRVYTTSNGTYRRAKQTISLPTYNEYLVEYDVLITKGTHTGTFASDTTTRSPNSGHLAESGHVSFTFRHDGTYTIDGFCLYSTWGTSEAGDQTISNFSVKWRPL